MDITSLCGKITEQQLEELEKKIGTGLPDDYRRFLLTYNTAEVQPNLFWIPAEKEENGVRYFFGICPDSYWGDLLFTRLSYKDRISPTFLLIATDEDSSFICLSIKASDYGKIYFWDRHYENMDELDDSNAFWLADNFTDFLNSLY